jgi:putative ABC transport system permease protein
MQASKLIWSCLSAMSRYKLRTGAMLLGSLIGVAALSFIVSIGGGLERKVQGTVQHFFNASTLLVTTGSSIFRGGPREPSARLTLDDLEAVAAAVPNVEIWDPIATLPAASVRRGDRTRTLRIFGNSERSERAWTRTVTRGEYFDAGAVAHSSRVALIGETASRQLFGDEDPLGAEILIGSVPFRVIGVLESLGVDAHGLDRDDEFVIPISTLMHRVLNTDTVSGGKFMFRNTSDVPDAARQVRTLLRERHGISSDSPDDFTVMTPEDMNAMVSKAKRVFFVLLPLAAAVAMLAGALVTAGLMLLSVSQRTAEIGLRRAVGASEQDIVVQFLGESALTTLLGGTLGLIIGVTGSTIVAERLGVESSLSLHMPLLALLVSTVFGMLAGIIPAKRAARLEPTDALR